MKKLIPFLMFMTLMSLTSFAQSSINVSPTAATTKTKVVPTLSGQTAAINLNSTGDRSFAAQQAADAEARLNKRQDSLVLAFNAFKLQQQETNDQQVKTNATIPKPVKLLPGRGIQFSQGADSTTFILTPQLYYDAVSKTTKQNY